MTTTLNPSPPIAPRGLSALSTFVRLAREPLALFVDAARRSPVTPLIGGARPLYLVSEPTLIHQVLLRDGRRFVRTPIPAIHELIGNSIVLRDGESWFARRKLLQPAFHRPHIARMAAVMEEQITTWSASWRSQPITHIPDLGHAMSELARRIIATVLFSTSLSHAVSDQLGQDISTCLDYTTARLMQPVNLPAWVPTPARRRFLAARTRMEEALLTCVRQRRADPNPPNDLLTLLAQAQDADTGEPMTDQELKGELVTVYLAGHETTAQVMTCLWMLIASRPDVLARMRAEVAQVRVVGQPLHESLHTLAYTRQVLFEVMRLYPPAYVTVRKATEAVNLGGVPIPAGAKLMISPYATHRLPTLWPDPEQFDPDRFANDQVSQTDGSYFPFLIGPKRCIGEHLAMQELLLMAALFVESVCITPQTPHIQMRAGTTLQMRPVAATIQPYRTEGSAAS